MIAATGGTKKYLTALTGENLSLTADVGTQSGGSGEYPGPHALLQAAFACCMDMTVRMVMDYRNIPYDEVSVSVHLDEDTAGKAIYRYRVDITGDLDDETKISVIKKATNCPVRKTLLKEIKFVNETPLLQSENEA